MTVERVTSLPALPARPADSHKGTYGRVLLIGGRPGMAGAISLAGLGALRGGAGLVDLAIPGSIAAIAGAIEPSYLTRLLPTDEQGELSGQVLSAITKETDGKTACGIGPGLGTSEICQQLVSTLYCDCLLPMVFDADALNCLVLRGADLSVHAGLRILTPHPGEFARLIHSDTGSVQKNREDLATEFARRHDLVLVLKGHQTVITDGRRIAINPTGNQGMATGGTGDVLTGLTTALLAQKMAPFEAAQLAAFLHGRAGDLAAQTLSEPGLIASDLPRFLGAAWKSVIGTQPSR